ncbi:hypothetical protein K0M31_013128 [Melipona bicolor]|uniref:Uncharacterized protein n=1 Tax=Melipona bicolor TaxID=60889 RepID=A0AA40KGZ3_9HYME|nr:hypothetical protein K0M31_013128 [Melipona bicolor]
MLFYYVRIDVPDVYNCLRLILIGNRVLYGLANVSGPRTFVVRSWFTVSSTDEVKAMIEAGVECKEVDAIRERETALASSYSKAS